LVAVDWYKEFNTISDCGFVRIVDNVLRSSRFFPVIADLWEASRKTGLCEKCHYSKVCTSEKKYSKGFGETCDSFIAPADR